MVNEYITKDEIKDLDVVTRLGLDSDDDLNFCRVIISEKLAKLLKNICVTNEIKEGELKNMYQDNYKNNPFKRFLIKDIYSVNMGRVKLAYSHCDLINKGRATFKFNKSEYAEKFKRDFLDGLNSIIRAVIQNG